MKLKNLKALVSLPSILLIMLFSNAAHAVLLVSDFRQGAIFEYDSNSGAYQGIFASGGGLVGPEAMRVGPDGSLYVGDFLADNIRRFDLSTGNNLGVFTSGGGLDGPHGFTFGPDGNMYVNNVFDDQVLRYNGTTGAYIDEFVTSGSGGLYQPRGITFGPDGNLYLTSNGSSADGSDRGVMRYDGTTGAFINSFTSPYTINKPRDLMFGPNGDLFVGSLDDNKVVRYDGLTGDFVSDFILGGANVVPSGLTIGPDGNFYIGSRDTGEILRYDINGDFIDIFATGGIINPTNIYFTPDSFAVPIPGSLLLFASGIIGFVGIGRRRSNK